MTDQLVHLYTTQVTCRNAYLGNGMAAKNIDSTSWPELLGSWAVPKIK